MLPEKGKDYVCKGKVISWGNQAHNKVKVEVGIFEATYTLTSYEVQAFISTEISQEGIIVVTIDMKDLLPQIWA
jgi:hypothetical protein